MRVAATKEQCEAVAKAHAFDRYETTGTLAFRRSGKAGGWRDSANFSPQVREVAQEVLGALRSSLGYRDSDAS
jgi:hypothetical protein